MQHTDWLGTGYSSPHKFLLKCESPATPSLRPQLHIARCTARSQQDSLVGKCSVIYRSSFPPIQPSITSIMSLWLPPHMPRVRGDDMEKSNCLIFP